MRSLATIHRASSLQVILLRNLASLGHQGTLTPHPSTAALEKLVGEAEEEGSVNESVLQQQQELHQLEYHQGQKIRVLERSGGISRTATGQKGATMSVKPQFQEYFRNRPHLQVRHQMLHNAVLLSAHERNHSHHNLNIHHHHYLRDLSQQIRPLPMKQQYLTQSRQLKQPVRHSPQLVLPANAWDQRSVPVGVTARHFFLPGMSSGPIRLQIKKQVAVPAEHFFTVVADVAQYSQFLPFCAESLVLPNATPGTSQEQNGVSKFQVKLVIGFRAISSSYVSEVTLDKPNLKIGSKALGSELFSHMDSHWTFVPASSGGCTICFDIEFEVVNPLHRETLRMFFDDVSQRQVSAFERRAVLSHSTLTAQQKLATTAKRKVEHEDEKEEPTRGEKSWLDDLLYQAVLHRERPGEQGSVSVTRSFLSCFYEEELARLREVYFRHATRVSTPGHTQTQGLDLAGFQALCRDLCVRHSLFRRFRFRFSLRAAADNSSIAESFFTLIQQSEHKEYIPFDVLVPHFFFITKASTWDRFEYTLLANARAKCSWPPSLKPQAFPVDVLVAGTRYHFNQQLSVIRCVVPAMVSRHATEERREGSLSPEDLLLHEISLLGAVSDVIDDTFAGVDETLEELTAELKIYSALAWPDTSVPLSKWIDMWRQAQHADLLEVTTVRGMSSLIQLFASLRDPVAPDWEKMQAQRSK
eukprot:gb/GEZN01003060.1/.p1 GENE.gb/GEZN01003060.1/~~gb/GEZN01003060.1/.p1  ORF type:complete len:698 (-),score=92.82 gb/GEZN01003060.1/:160-2253(-)